MILMMTSIRLEKYDPQYWGFITNKFVVILFRIVDEISVNPKLLYLSKFINYKAFDVPA